MITLREERQDISEERERGREQAACFVKHVLTYFRFWKKRQKKFHYVDCLGQEAYQV